MKQGVALLLAGHSGGRRWPPQPAGGRWGCAEAAGTSRGDFVCSKGRCRQHTGAPNPQVGHLAARGGVLTDSEVVEVLLAVAVAVREMHALDPPLAHRCAGQGTERGHEEL